MNKYLIILSSWCLALILLSGCSKDIQFVKEEIGFAEDDSNAPTIIIVKPENNNIFSRGGNIVIEAFISDDVFISKYKVEINPVDSELINGWNYSEEKTISEEEFDFESKTIFEQLSITIPDNTPIGRGMYYFSITAVDGTNKSSTAQIEIEII